MPVTYTGPVPPTPTATSTDAGWHNWWAYQTILQNIRYENEREAARAKALVDEAAAAARQVVLDRQHGERMTAEAKCAESNKLLAEAQQAMAAALRVREPLPADDVLIQQFMRAYIEAGVPDAQVAARAKSRLADLKAATAPIFAAP